MVVDNCVIFALLLLITQFSQAAVIPIDKEDELTTVSAIPISKSEETTTVGWVPIADDNFEVGVTFDSTTIEPTTKTKTTGTPSSFSTTTTDYSTTSFKDAQIQYRPYGSYKYHKAEATVEEDVPMPMIDIQLPFNNHSHIVTWLDPDKMSPKLNRDLFQVEHPNVTVINRVKRGTGSLPQHSVWSANHFCGGDFTQLSGILRSPGFPLYYPNNKECRYRIAVPENHTIKFSCDNFELQGHNGTDCSHDYMTIMEGAGVNDTESLIGAFCGQSAPTVSTQTNKMTVIFKSDQTFRYRGFKCRFRAIQPNGIAVINSFGDDSNDADLAYLDSTSNQVVYANNFFSGQSGNCDQQVAHENTAANGNDPNYQSANLYGGLWSGTCGTSNLFSSSTSGGTDRIVGGNETAEHQYPWMISILRECESEFCHVCGGTIISPAWILTSAHCVSSVPLEEMGILMGDHNLYELSYEQKFVRAIEKVTHPDFNDPTILNNDIGLVRLENDISFTKFINPLCLPPMGETGFGNSAYGDGNSSTLDTAGLNIVGKNATVIGWGAVNDDGIYPDGLHEVDVQVLDNKVCSDLYGPMITETMMCTSGMSGRGTCFGDSGGPALVKSPDGSYVQVGIVSFGANAGCENGYPSGQVLVHKFIDWIQHVTGIHV